MFDYSWALSPQPVYLLWLRVGAGWHPGPWKASYQRRVEGCSATLNGIYYIK